MRYAIIEKSSDECVKFLHLTVVDAPVAQLDRVSDSDSEGRAFESHRAYHDGVTKKMSHHFFQYSCGFAGFLQQNPKNGFTVDVQKYNRIK